MFFQSRQLRSLLIALYRTYARAIIFYPAPRILVNSIPKAGTHLLTNVLQEFPKVMLTGLHIRMSQVHRPIVPRVTEADFQLDPEAFRRRLLSVHSGQVATAHLPWRPEIEPILQEIQIRSIFLIRDPRDIVVSQIYYRLGLRRHRLHHRMKSDFHSDAERLMACITGMPPHKGGDQIPGIGERIAQRMGWTHAPNCHVTRFEDLVGARGGGDPSAQRREIKALAAHFGRPLTDEAVERLIHRLALCKSFTFRRGLIGDWQNHFTEEHNAAFKEHAGRFLIELGYETGFDW